MKGKTLPPTTKQLSFKREDPQTLPESHTLCTIKSEKVYRQQLTAGFELVNILVEITPQQYTKVSIQTKCLGTYMPGKNAK